MQATKVALFKLALDELYEIRFLVQHLEQIVDIDKECFIEADMERQAIIKSDVLRREEVAKANDAHSTKRKAIEGGSMKKRAELLKARKEVVDPMMDADMK